MANLKRSLALILAAFMVLSVFALFGSTAFAAETNSGSPFVAPSSMFVSSTTAIERGQFAVMLDKLFGYQATAKNTFKDLDPSSKETNAILRAAAAGVVVGVSGGKIRPSDKLTREEFAFGIAKAFDMPGTIIKGLPFADESLIAADKVKQATTLVYRGYMSADKAYNFNPKGEVTINEARAVLDKVVPMVLTKAATYTGVIKGTVLIQNPKINLRNATVEGDLIIAHGVGKNPVTLTDVTVAGKTIVYGGNVVNLKGTTALGSIVSANKSSDVKFAFAKTVTAKNIYIAPGSKNVTVEGADIERISNASSGSVVNVTKGKVAHLVMSAPLSVANISQPAAKAEILKKATKAVINVLTGGKVTQLVVSASNTKIDGPGKVEKATISGVQTYIGTYNTAGAPTPATIVDKSGGTVIRPGATTSTTGSFAGWARSGGSGSSSSGGGNPVVGASFAPGASVTVVKANSEYVIGNSDINLIDLRLTPIAGKLTDGSDYYALVTTNSNAVGVSVSVIGYSAARVDVFSIPLSSFITANTQNQNVQIKIFKYDSANPATNPQSQGSTINIKIHTVDGTVPLPPTAGIDYVAENITGINNTMEYMAVNATPSINTATYKKVPAVGLSAIPGASYSIRVAEVKNGNIVVTPAGIAAELVAPARPAIAVTATYKAAAPTVKTIGVSDGVPSDYLWGATAQNVTTPIVGTSITSTPNTFFVLKKAVAESAPGAGDGAFKSAPVSVTATPVTNPAITAAATIGSSLYNTSSSVGISVKLDSGTWANTNIGVSIDGVTAAPIGIAGATTDTLTFTLTLPVGTSNTEYVGDIIEIQGSAGSVTGDAEATTVATLTRIVDPDFAVVANAKIAIEGMTLNDVAVATLNTAADAKTHIEGLITALGLPAGVSTTVNTVGFSTAEDGTTVGDTGTNGSYVFNVTITSGVINDTTSNRTLTITGSAYVDPYKVIFTRTAYDGSDLTFVGLWEVRVMNNGTRVNDFSIAFFDAGGTVTGGGFTDMNALQAMDWNFDNAVSYKLYGFIDQFDPWTDPATATLLSSGTISTYTNGATLPAPFNT